MKRIFILLMMVTLQFGCSTKPVVDKPENGFSAPKLWPSVCDELVYPRASYEAHEKGTVEMSFLVSRDGTVLEKKMTKSSGFPRLDEATNLARNHCQFFPALQDGEPVQSWVTLSTTW